jgi:hypothetical protein
VTDPIVDRLVSAWVVFEPRTDGQQVLHAQTLAALDDFLDLRRDRQQSVKEGLKPVMWVVLVLGGAITIGFMFLFQAERPFAHMIMTAGLSMLIGLVMYWIFTMDRPFMGNESVSAERFEAVLTTMDRLGPPVAK